MATNDFINECKKGANSNRLGKIIVSGVVNPLTQSNYIADFSIDSGCYVDGNIIGSIYIKKLEGNLLAVPDNIELIDKPIQAQIGVKYANNTTEYINMGNYTVERPNDEKTANKSKITAYDNLMNKINDKYICGIDYTGGNITLQDVYIDVCSQLNLTPSSTSFINDDIPVENNPFTNNETNRIVLQTVAKIACSFITIDEVTDEIDLSWLSDSENPDYTFQLSDYSTLEGGTIEYGPVNSVTIKNSAVDDENITQQDSESIEEYGEHSVIISEDYILYNSTLRQQAITAIFNRLNGLKYVDSKITCYYGKPFLKIGDKIRIYKDSENYFDTYVLKHNFKYDGAFTSIIESPALTSQEIKTKQDISLKEALRNTEIKVDKQNGTIELLNTQTTQIQDNLNNNYYDIEQTNDLIANVETGLTNTFTQSGGNNILRNTGLWFKQSDSNNPFEYWTGTALQASNDNASCKTSIILQDNDFKQSQQVANGNYTISFKYKKLISLATATVTINDRTYNLTETSDTEFYTGQKDNNGEYIVQPLEVSSNQISIKFTSDTDNAVEIYDLMCNQGTEKSVWSQNQNETTTDTVNISQGITIISNTKNTKFKADADGVRIFDKNDSTNSNPITEFTDKGMTTKEAIIENQATIVGILRQQVGDQIWDCLII